MLRFLLVLISVAAPVQQTPAILETVIQRATEYVTKYEEELDNLIGTEDYIQDVAWKDAGMDAGTIARREKRRTSSDFLIIQVGSDWQALRKTNRVDGKKVKETQQDFQTSFDDSPSSNTKRLNEMKADSTMYNIGGIVRSINLPTFALEVLRKNEVTRFSFDKSGIAKIGGLQTWGIRFREVRSGTLVRGQTGQDLFSHGTLWIEPETGRVLKTEFMVENPFVSAPIRARTIVMYGAVKNLDMLVPTVMMEHYENEYNAVECRAEYSNFRRFEVEVKFDLKPPGN